MNAAREIPIFALAFCLSSLGFQALAQVNESLGAHTVTPSEAAVSSTLDKIDSALDGRRVSESNPLRSRDYVLARRLLTQDLERIGGPESQASLKLAKLLIAGRGGPVDLTQARRLLASALAARSGEAALLLAELELVDPTEAHRTEAERFFRLGMRFGSVDCYLGLARLLGPQTDEGRIASEVGIKLLQAQMLNPAEKGAALIKLGDINRDGEFVAKNIDTAAKLYQQASEVGDVRAAVRLGKLLSDSASTLFNGKAASDWLRRAANAGDVEAALRLVKDGYFEHRLGTSSEEARLWLANAVEAGDAKALLIRLVLKNFETGAGDVEGELLERARGVDISVSDLIEVAAMSVAKDTHPKAVRLAVQLFKIAQEGNSPEARYRHGRLVLENLDIFQENEVAAAVVGLQVAAEAGSPGALNLLARAYRYGIGVEADQAKAKSLYEREIHEPDEVRSAEAMLSLGEMLITSADPTEIEAALSWFETAAEHGSLEAVVALGRIYSAGSITVRDPVGAKSLLETAVSAGSVQGSVELADVLADENLTLNLNRVIALYQRAISFGDRRGYERLVQLHDNPVAKPTVETYLGSQAAGGNFPAKLALLQILSGRRFVTDASQNTALLGSIVDAAKSEGERLAVAEVLKDSADQGLLETSERLLLDLWKQGSRTAGTAYAAALLDHRFGADRTAEGRGIAEELAGVGWNPARLVLGHAWRKGVFGKKDPEQAVKLYEAVFRDDPRNPEARLYLARAYESGEGTSRDLSRAANMFATGAALGDIPSMVELGECYALGLGVAQDPSSARRWLSQAATSGQETAILAYADYLSALDGGPFASGEGYDLYLSLARRGSPTSMLRVGRALLAGVGTDRDQESGLYWLQRAAERDEANAAFELARYWTASDDAGKADLWLQRAGEMGNPSAMLRIGLVAANEGQIEEAKKWLSWAVDHDSEPARAALKALSASETAGQEDLEQ